MRYGEVLQHYLDAKGMSRSELARRVGCGRSQITEYINGESKEPTLTRAKKIADALDVPLEEMLSMLFDK